MSKYLCTILISESDYEKFKQICDTNKFIIIDSRFKTPEDEPKGWYSKNCYQIELVIKLKIWVVKLLNEYNLYDGITFTGISGKDAGLSFHK